MIEKRFKLRLSKLGNGMITDTQKRKDLYFDKDFLDAALLTTHKWLNELAEENKQLKQQLKEYKQPNCKRCIEYSQDGVADYCMSEDGLLGDAWKMFPCEWDYTNAKDCKEYEE